jgi:hypothetical protein
MELGFPSSDTILRVIIGNRVGVNNDFKIEVIMV